MDVIRLCLDAGVPLSLLETFRGADGTLEWRGVMEAGRTRVRREMARLRNLEVSLDDYLNEVTRKARTPDDGVVRSDLPSTWMVGRPWPHAECAFALKPYLRAMDALRAAVRAAGLPRLLRRGILLDRREWRAYAYQQFDPEAARCVVAETTDDAAGGAGPFGFDASLAVFHPIGGYGEGRVIERESLSACFDEAFATATRDDPDEWPHATICEIWGSHTTEGVIRVRLTRHRCDAGRVRKIPRRKPDDPYDVSHV